MKMKTALIALWIFLLWLPQSVSAEALIPVGEVIGLELQEGRVIVAGFDDALGRDTMAAGIQVGDEIRTIDEMPVHSAEDVREALNHSRGLVTLGILRDGAETVIRVSPQITADGPRLGLLLRQGVTGIGTVTWYDSESGRFGALGHGVNNSDGALVDMTAGTAFSAKVQSVKQGKVGQPGQLVGAVTDPKAVGFLDKNTGCGIFGTSEAGWEGEPLPVGGEDSVHMGDAVIRSTVCGETTRDYSVTILKIYAGDRPDGRNMLIRVTDPALLEATGGIVQGMSGSPIIQDGKLIGAVTHVLVNQPDTGYGIFIENMLQAAG